MFVLKHKSSELYLCDDTQEVQKPVWSHINKAKLLTRNLATQYAEQLQKRGHHVYVRENV